MKLREDFLHYIWRFKQFDLQKLITTSGDTVHIYNFGQYNTDGGADFLNGKIELNGRVWYGNIELHINASDWHRHKHNDNPAYNNVILHVVFNADQTIIRSNGEAIPTVELRGRIPLKLKNTYLRLLNEKEWIPCANQIQNVPSFIKTSWLDRLTIERLEQKTQLIEASLNRNNNNWEETFYQMIARSFGLHINVDPFERVAQKLPLITLTKHKDNLFQLESLLFGQAGLLQGDFQETYPNRLKKEFDFLQKKHQLEPIPKTMWQFLRLRPPSFPTIRLAQFAALIHQSTHLFSKVLDVKTIEDIEELLVVKMSDYWQTHYVFDKESTKRKKTLGKSTIHLIVINTIAPLLFLYGQKKKDEDFKEKAIQLLEAIPAESNSVIKKWATLDLKPENAYQSQALLQLKKHYCKLKRCLHCNIGNNILRK